MPDTLSPQFPPFSQTPESLKSASQQALNIWVGAMSPLWAPFWAATSFGLGAWMVSQSLTRTEDMMKGMPLNSKWPSLWGLQATAAQAMDKAVEDVVEKAMPVMKAATSVVAEEVEAVVAAVEGTTRDGAPAKVETVIDPVIEAPVKIAKPVVEAASDTVAKAAKMAKTTAKVEPKDIAKTMAVNTPKTED